jgi:hypothetical protein
VSGFPDRTPDMDVSIRGMKDGTETFVLLECICHKLSKNRHSRIALLT